VLPNPVHLRDMLLRARLSPDSSLALNREFLEYQKAFRRGAEARRKSPEVVEVVVSGQLYDV